MRNTYLTYLASKFCCLCFQKANSDRIMNSRLTTICCVQVRLLIIPPQLHGNRDPLTNITAIYIVKISNKTKENNKPCLLVAGMKSKSAIRSSHAGTTLDSRDPYPLSMADSFMMRAKNLRSLNLSKAVYKKRVINITVHICIKTLPELLVNRTGVGVAFIFLV